MARGHGVMAMQAAAPTSNVTISETGHAAPLKESHATSEVSG